VLMGAGVGASGMRRAAPAAALVAAHTLAVTALSRSEVTGAEPRLPRATLAATGAIGALAAFAGPFAGRIAGPVVGRGRGAGPCERLSGAALLAVYGATFGRAQLAAVRDPGPQPLQRAVGAGILGLMPLQAALTAGAGAPAAALPVAAAFPLARRLSRRVSPT
jgi:hypothetical protein